MYYDHIFRIIDVVFKANWTAAASKALLVQPSSAASEHILSMLKASLIAQQDSSLQDYLEAPLMLHLTIARQVVFHIHLSYQT